jgi:hypothetical protein
VVLIVTPFAHLLAALAFEVKGGGVEKDQAIFTPVRALNLVPLPLVPKSALTIQDKFLRPLMLSYHDAFARFRSD